MEKRKSIQKELKTRLDKSRMMLNTSFEYEALANVLGGDTSRESAFRLTMKNDIEQLEFLIKSLVEFKARKLLNELSSIT